MYDEQQNAHDGDLRQNLYGKHPIVKMNFLFAQKDVQVEIVETVDQDHQQGDFGITLRDNIVESVWKIGE